MPVAAQDLIVDRADIARAEVVGAELPDPPEGHALLRVDLFALTSNNVSYAVSGDALGYWKFFPTDRDGWGRVPVWGFADVVASARPDVPEGTRVYGFLPPSTHVLVRPDKVSATGFMDGAEHRRGLPPIYNQHLRADADPLWRPEREGLIALFRPLFTTSFLLEDFHRRNAFFGADALILTSASSKTTLGLARLLRAHGDAPEVVGVTGPGNRAFVEGLGLYDRVIGYDEVESVPARTAALVDMAGSAGFRAAVHHRWADDLKSSRPVGLTHWEEASGLRGQDLPGPKPEFFFAPTHAQELIAAIGAPAFHARVAEAWEDFIAFAEPWVRVARHDGSDAALAAWAAVLAGGADPAEGTVIRL